MPIDKTKLKKFKSIIKLIDESVSREEIESNIKKILDFLLKLKEKNQGEFKNLNQKFGEQSEKMKGDNAVSISELKAEFTKIINKALKDQSDSLNFMRDKARNLKNGKDGKQGPIGPVGPQGSAGSPDTPVMVADKLELLEDDNRLKIEAIMNLEKRLKDLEDRPVGGGGGGKKITYIKRINLSSQCNGILKTFILPKNVIAVIGVFGTQFPITFDEADFTLSGHSLTLTGEVSAPKTDQTLFCLVETLFFG